MPPLCTLLLGLLLLHTPHWCISAAVNDDTLAAGKVLAVSGKLVSRNGKFALGFFQPATSTIISKSSHNATSSSWYLGIWFNKIPVFTTVWVANRDQPITNTNLNLTQLEVSSDCNLVIVNHAGDTESIVWSTQIVNNRTQSSSINNTCVAVLLNTGNLVLTATESPSSSNQLLWQSFDYPTDVVLPGAKFGRNKVTGLNRQPISRKSLIDPGLGAYSIELDTTGIVLKRRNPSVVYWNWASSRTSSLNLIPILKSILDLDPRTKGVFLGIAFAASRGTHVTDLTFVGFSRASRRQSFLSASSVFTGTLINKHCFVCFIFTGLFTVRSTFFG
ncbi:hypothetical protein QYE76_042127 [Lolium multiflorum]|uniref:non-specific serine/threonine protein kinase n=1 Tax=Lolium multiflorum TaxID=4521 RepID=A0AAD8TEN4_LOLMU|nr:hypothetical protein QYE76_042127 [Lolium multiflorum]